MELEQEVMACVAEALALSPAAAAELTLGTALLGVHPDFNSMSVLALLTALEDRLGLTMGDDVQAESFASVATLVADVRVRLNGGG